MKNIVLTGFMGAGKSSVGRIPGEKLQMRVIDTDDMIEKDAGMSISDIFSKHDESHFRELEEKVVQQTSNLSGYIIITGGGAILNKENMENLRKKGVIIYLHTTPEIIYNRIKGKTHRPLLQVKNPLKKIKELLDFRAPFYANNDIEVKTSNLSVDEVVEEIIQKIDIIKKE
jgi:shikimate kinase